MTRIIILILLLVSAMLTHYYAAHALLALAIYLMLRLQKRERRRVLMGFCIAAVIFCAVWGPSMWHQRGNFTTNLTWSQEASGGNLSRTLLRAASLPVRYLILPGRSDRWLTCGSAVMYLLPALLLRKHPELALWWMMMLISVAAVAAADVTRSGWMLELLRYTAVASPAMCALLAILLCGAGAKRGWILCTALAVTIGSTLSHTYNYTHENYGGVGDYLRPRISRDDALVIIDTPWYPPASNAFYLAATYEARELPKVLIVLTKPADDLTLQQLRGCRRVWVIDGSQADFGRMLGGAVAQQGDFFPRVGTVQAVVIP